MKNLFSLDSPLIRGLGKIADLMILNVLYLLSCIPIVTIGAATAALYDVTFRLSKDDALIWRHYWQAFASNFKKATVLWLIIAAIGGAIYGCASFYWTYDLAAETLPKALLVIAFALWAMAASWVFPLQAKFENTIKHTLKNGLIFSWSFLPRTIVVTVLNLVAPAVFLFLPGVFLYVIFLWLILWFSVAAYVSTLLLKKPFSRLEEMAEEQA